MNSVQVQEDADFKELVDEFAAMHLHLQSIQKSYDEKKKQLQAVANSSHTKTKLTLQGYEFSLEFSESPQKSVVPDDVTADDLYEAFGLGAFSPSISAIKAIESGRNREFGFSPSVLVLKWESRRLLSAFKHS